MDKSRRERLPDRRPSELFDFDHDGIAYTAEFSRYADGRIAEVFVDGHKVTAATSIAMRDAAIILSIALQHGGPVESIRSALSRDHSGRPLGPMGTLLDLLAPDQPAGPAS